MRDTNASAVGDLGNATTLTRKHDRPSDLHTECRGCELGLSMDDDSHMCYTVAGPTFNRTRTSVNADILTQANLCLPYFPLLTPLLPH